VTPSARADGAGPTEPQALLRGGGLPDTLGLCATDFPPKALRNSRAVVGERISWCAPHASTPSRAKSARTLTPTRHTQGRTRTHDADRDRSRARARPRARERMLGTSTARA
jgi:hypothetical protein